MPQVALLSENLATATEWLHRICHTLACSAHQLPGGLALTAHTIGAERGPGGPACSHSSRRCTIVAELVLGHREDTVLLMSSSTCKCPSWWTASPPFCGLGDKGWREACPTAQEIRLALDTRGHCGAKQAQVKASPALTLTSDLQGKVKGRWPKGSHRFGDPIIHCTPIQVGDRGIYHVVTVYNQLGVNR